MRNIRTIGPGIPYKHNQKEIISNVNKINKSRAVAGKPRKAV